MTASTAAPRLSDQFNAFLRSALWPDRDETPLSVLSALARLDVDPWEEAARLAALPRLFASARLAAMLANLPGGPAVRRDLDAICVRSVSLLAGPSTPHQVGAAPAAPLSRGLHLPGLGSWVARSRTWLQTDLQEAGRPPVRWFMYPSWLWRHRARR